MFDLKMQALTACSRTLQIFKNSFAMMRKFTHIFVRLYDSDSVILNIPGI